MIRQAIRDLERLRDEALWSGDTDIANAFQDEIQRFKGLLPKEERGMADIQKLRRTLDSLESRAVDAKAERDMENCHHLFDDILLEVIEALGPNIPQVQEILKMYNEVRDDFWYA